MGYNEEAKYQAECAQQVICGMNAIDRSPTLGENIERRITALENEILRLKKTRALIEEGRWLEVQMSDLNLAMRY